MKLEIGYNCDFEIRKEVCENKKLRNASILYLSDLHLTGYSTKIIHSLSAAIAKLNPTILLLGGDYADTPKGHLLLSEFLKSISNIKNTFAIAGNHDYFRGIDKIKDIFISNNITWIEQTSVIIPIDNFLVRISGNLPNIEKGNVDFSILCLHKPIDLSPYQDNFDLAFGGHLHGCQFILWKKGENLLFPGRLFYKWNILKTKIGNCLYLISKGLGDTLPIRINCKRDILFVELT